MDLERLKELALAATPGEWKAYDACVRIAENPHKLITAGIHCDIEEAARNARHIAAANPATVLALIAELEKLRGERFEPKFDAMAPGQKKIAIQFGEEIASRNSETLVCFDPVRLLEMAEALYLAERDDAANADPAQESRQLTRGS